MEITAEEARKLASDTKSTELYNLENSIKVCAKNGYNYLYSTIEFDENIEIVKKLGFEVKEIRPNKNYRIEW